MSKIAIDVMGGDNAPTEIIKGIIDASRETDADLILVGNKSIIEKELKSYTYDKDKLTIVDAKEVISMEDSPMVIRTKRDSSMVVGLNLVKEKKADVLVSAGNTGALLTGATLIVGRLKGVERPALATLIPTDKGNSLLIDSGANSDIKANYLPMFAKMGTIYMEELMNVKNPKVGLVNIGVEEEKGNLITKEAYLLLKDDASINFIGNIEARDVVLGEYDILVCDGFVGNIILKNMEGFGMWILGLLKEQFTQNWIRKIGALILKPALKSLMVKFDYAEHGGAPLLGLKGLVIKTHGSAKAKQVKNTILQAVKLADQDVSEKIKNKINS